MLMDILVILIFALTVAASIKRGFALTIASFIKGIASLVIAWIFHGKLATWVLTNTEFAPKAVERLSQYLSGTIQASKMYDALPEIIKGNGAGANALATNGAQKLVDMFVPILCFIVIVIAIRILAFLITKLFSHKHHEGVIAASDRFFGLLVGLVLGLIYAMLFLALLLPVVGIVAPGSVETVTGLFESSYFAKDLYDNNLILLLFRNLIL